MTKQESVEAAVRLVVEDLGHINFLVHCTGNNIKPPTLEITLEQWKISLNIHLTGAFLFCWAAGRQMVKQGDGGRIVLMSSVTAITPLPERGRYGLAKAGVINLAQMISLG